MATELGNDWRLKAMGAKVKFAGCPLGEKCEYEGNLNLEVQMDATGSFFEPKNAAFTEGCCIKRPSLCRNRHMGSRDDRFAVDVRRR